MWAQLFWERLLFFEQIFSFKRRSWFWKHFVAWGKQTGSHKKCVVLKTMAKHDGVAIHLNYENDFYYDYSSLHSIYFFLHADCLSGPGCSKLTTSLVNETLKFQTLISEICQHFLLKKCEKLFQCKSFSHFFNKKYQCIWSFKW